MAKQTIKLTESKLRSIVESTVRETLKESFLSKAKNTVRNGFNAIDKKMDDLAQGYNTLEGNPQSEADVFKGNGWIIIDEQQNPNGKSFKVKRTSGAFGGFYGKEIEELIEDMMYFLNGNGTIEYIGKSKDIRGAEEFEVRYY